MADELELMRGLRDLQNRLRGRYAKGPIQANGEPEFGWVVFERMPDGRPFPNIYGEAADFLDKVAAALEREGRLVELVRAVPVLFVDRAVAEMQGEDACLKYANDMAAWAKKYRALSTITEAGREGEEEQNRSSREHAPIASGGPLDSAATSDTAPPRPFGWCSPAEGVLLDLTESLMEGLMEDANLTSGDRDAMRWQLEALNEALEQVRAAEANGAVTRPPVIDGDKSRDDPQPPPLQTGERGDG